MAIRAFVLIDTAVGKSNEIMTALRGFEEVMSADRVTGPHDVIAVIESLDLETVGDVVTSRVQRLPGVVRTLTCLATPLS